MKNFNWQTWTAIGIIAAVIITLIVLHLVQPTLTFAWCEVFTVCAFILGVATGYFLKARNIINSAKPE